MSQKIKIISPTELSSFNHKEEFRRDILAGLSQRNKHIPSKYFYDDKGCHLFNQITDHADYYLTRCELEIINNYKKEISYFLGGSAFNLIELGPGDGSKTQLLIDQFMKDLLHFSYVPIELSHNFLSQIVNQFSAKYPELEIQAIHSNFIQGLQCINDNSSLPKLLLFLGSSIANLDLKERSEFLGQLWNCLNNNDYILIGFDLRKDSNTLLRAYDDSAGLTKQFNLNILNRINRELQGNFDLNKFKHHASYNISDGVMDSYLLSLETQSVLIKDLDTQISFETDESIHVEYSFKFNELEIRKLAHENGFEVIDMYFDNNHYFLDALWHVVK